MQKMVCNHFLSCFCCVLFWWILIAFTELCAFEYMNDLWWVWWCWMSVGCVNLSLCSSVDSRSNSHGCFNRSVQSRTIFRNTSPKVKCFFRLYVSVLPLNKFRQSFGVSECVIGITKVTTYPVFIVKISCSDLWVSAMRVKASLCAHPNQLLWRSH